VPTLVGFSTPRGVAILGVVSYRLVNFWLPIPMSGATYVSLRVEQGRSSGVRPWKLHSKPAEPREPARSAGDS
jgi:hypothetical protein